ncbi:M20/M25/M40 family metallo-hydrolase [Patescibacteria group bacterium]|nr:M20/M25/M40 family metallo-hydrolase [Patescibacteria group bacterium]
MNTLEILDKINSVGNSCEGRNVYALSGDEDEALGQVHNLAISMFNKYSKQIGIDYHIEHDAFGNLYIKYYGQHWEQTVMSGSHIDSVRNGGKYDGVLGIASALNLLEKILENGQLPEYTYTVAAFRSEESNPCTGVSALGSKIATGSLKPAELENIGYKNLTVDSLENHFRSRFGRSLWNDVLNCCMNPYLTTEKVRHFEELHIEQSRVIEIEEGDVGIVRDGIGGNEKIEFSGQVPVQTFEAHTNEFVSLSLSFKGKADHTGGTPNNNPNYHKNLRQDALIGLSKMFGLLRKMMNPEADLKVTGTYPQEETGFTTIPHHQCLDIIVTKEKYDDFKRIIEKISDTLFRELGIKVEISRFSILKPGTYKSLKLDAIRHALDIPKSVANIASGYCYNKPVIEIAGSTFGLVRATVTDFSLLANGEFKFKIDERNVDSNLANKMGRDIRIKVSTLLYHVDPNLKANLRFITKQGPAFIDQQSVTKKRELAKAMGLKTIEMPSMPGHDAWSLSKTGIPTSMTFVRHNGLSHNKDESVEKEYVTKAVSLSHAFLANKLGLEL